MQVGRPVRGRKARAAALVVIGAPLWLLGTTAAAQTAPEHSEWPVTPPEQPASRRLWPPPAPARPRPPATSTEAAPSDEDETPSTATPRPAPPSPATEATPPRENAPASDPNLAPAADPNQIAAPPAAPPAPPAQPLPQWPAGGVFVELRSDDPHVRIDQVSQSGPSLIACEIPCRQILFRKITYVIQSDQSPPTSTFLLPEGTNQVTLDVRAGSQPLRNVGVVLAVAGGVAAISGFIGLTTTSGSPSSDKTGLELLGLGAVVGITGMIMYWTSRTSVTSSTGITFSERPRAKARSTPAIALTPQGLVF